MSVEARGAVAARPDDRHAGPGPAVPGRGAGGPEERETKPSGSTQGRAEAGASGLARAGEDPGGASGTADAGIGQPEANGAVGAGQAATEGRKPARGTSAFLYAVLLLIPTGLFLAPLATFIIWRLRRREPFVDFHARQSLDLVLGGMVGVAVHLGGRHAGSAPLGIALQWTGLAVVVLQGLLVVWGMVDAGRGRVRRLPLSLPVLRWPQRQVREWVGHG